MQLRTSSIFSVGLAVTLSSCSISTYVSTERGVYSWQKLSEVATLRELLLTVPPPLPKQRGGERKENGNGLSPSTNFSLRDHERTYLKFCAIPVVAMLAYLISTDFAILSSIGSMLVGIQLAAVFAGRYLTRDSTLYLGFIGHVFGLFGVWAEDQVKPDNSKIQATTFWILSSLGIGLLLFFSCIPILVNQ